jgi:hypothetical protein
MSTRRAVDANGDSVRYDGSSETFVRGSRWPMISRTNRATPADDKIRRSQVSKALKKFDRGSFILIYRISSVLFVEEVGYLIPNLLTSSSSSSLCDGCIQLASSSSSRIF